MYPSSIKGAKSELYPIIDLCNGGGARGHNATVVHTKGGRMAIRATRPIAAGDQVSAVCKVLTRDSKWEKWE